MDNLIPPLNSPTQNITGTENTISGNITTTLPEEAQLALKQGQSYLLKVLMSEMSTQGGTILKTQLSVNNQSYPVELKVDAAIQLPPEKENQLQIKIGALNQDNQLSIKLTSVNNEPVVKYVSREVISGQSQKLQTVASPETAPLVKITQSNVGSEFHPLKISQILKNISAKLNLPSTVTTILEENFNQAEIGIKLQAPEKTTPTALPTKLNTADVEPVKNTVERLELILKGFTENLHGKPPYKMKAEHFIFQIKNELMSLKDSLMTGTAFSNSDNKLLALRTALGNFLPEQPIKLENLSNVLLKINEIKIPLSVSEMLPQELQSSRDLTSGLMSLVQSLKEVLESVPQAPIKAQDLVSLLKKLQTEGQQSVADKIIERLPSVNDKMFENMRSFVKGATAHKAELWLGQDITRELRNLGSEGMEINNRLNDFMNASFREGATWKIINLPFINGGELERIRIAIKKFDEERAEKNKSKHKKSARFVIDTNFSRLGSFQFDGFSYVKDRQFDLIIRTSKEIDETLKNNIFGIFKQTLHGLHYAGTVRINVKENFIKICEDNTQEETLKQGLYV